MWCLSIIHIHSSINIGTCSFTHIKWFLLLYFYCSHEPKTFQSQNWLTGFQWIQHQDTTVPSCGLRLMSSAKLFLVRLWTGLWIPREGTEIIKLISHDVIKEHSTTWKSLVISLPSHPALCKWPVINEWSAKWAETMHYFHSLKLNAICIYHFSKTAQ